MRRRRPAYSFTTTLLYATTLALEVPVIYARMLVLSALAWVMLHATGHWATAPTDFSQLALAPTVFSVLAFLTPIGGGWWLRQTTGGRKPSHREQLAYNDAIELLEASGKPLPHPRSWFVLDEPHPNAAVCSETLMLSRGLLESHHLPAVIAHELGHLAHHDGRVTAALNRLIINPPRPTQPPGTTPPDTQPRPILLTAETLPALTLIGAIAWTIRKAISFARGGFGLRITAPLWGHYWREREYHADTYAKTLGQADELADFLEEHALIHDHPTPLIWLTYHTHPSTELRLQHLRTNPTPTPQLTAA